MICGVRLGSLEISAPWIVTRSPEGKRGCCSLPRVGCTLSHCNLQPPALFLPRSSGLYSLLGAAEPGLEGLQASRSPAPRPAFLPLLRQSWRRRSRERSGLIYIVNVVSFEPTPVAFPSPACASGQKLAPLKKKV